MLEKLKNPKLWILLIIVICIIIAVVMYVNYIINLPEKSYGTEIDKTIEIYDTSFGDLTNIENAFSIFDVFQLMNEYLNMSNDDNKNKILYSILDNVYIDYYNVKKNNACEILNEYLNKSFVIKSMKVARISGNYSVFLVDSILGEQNYQFIVKLYPGNMNFSIIFPNYVEEYGLENYISNDLTTDNNTIQDTEYNKYLYKSYTDEEIVKKYSEILSTLNFDYIYKNYIGETTKANYTFDEIKDFYDSEDFYFKRPAIINLESKANDDYTLYTYMFKDRKMNEYTIAQKNVWDFTIDFIKVEEEEITNPDGGGLLEIIQQ